MKSFTGPAGLALAFLLASACGSSDAGAPSSPCSSATRFPPVAMATLQSDGGKLHVELRAAPYQPLISGLDCVELVVTDPSTGASVDGLTVTMTPWMTAMGHGASVTPAVAPLGHGRYVFTNVSLFMPGEWQLRTRFSGQVNDRVEPVFNVE